MSGTSGARTGVGVGVGVGVGGGVEPAGSGEPSAHLDGRDRIDDRSPRLSVIIPALDEAASIGAVIDRARQGGPHEVIVVDGHSDDATVAVAGEHGGQVITSARGRGIQMNAGAAVATGDVFLFLHADTLLPQGFERHVAGVLAEPGVEAGAFRLRIDAAARRYRLVEALVNWRSRRLQMPYGDQAFFLSAATFRLVGGYPDIPAMEDYELVRRVRRRGRVAIAPVPVVTSARRWRRGGIIGTTLLNRTCLLAYGLGVSADRIAAWRHRSPTGGRRCPGGGVDVVAVKEM